MFHRLRLPDFLAAFHCFLLASFCFSPLLRADTCMWSRSADGSSEDERFLVEIRWDLGADQWGFRWTDRHTEEKLRGLLQGIDRHCHLDVYVADDGSRFLVTDLSAGHRTNDRLLVYSSSGKLIRSIGIDDVLLFHERAEVSHSVSHTDWLGYDSEKKRFTGFDRDHDAFHLVTPGGHTAVISLVDGKVTRTPWYFHVLRAAPLILIGLAGVAALLRLTLRSRIPVDLAVFLELSIVALAVMTSTVYLEWNAKTSWFFGNRFLATHVTPSVCSIASLIVTWLMVGPGRWPRRLTAATLGTATLLATMQLVCSGGLLFWTVASSAIVSTLLLIVAAWSGYSLRQSKRDAAEKQSGSRSSTQFRLVDGLIWIASVAVLLCVTTFANSEQTDFQFQIRSLLPGLVFSVIAFAIVRILLGTPSMRLGAAVWTGFAIVTWAVQRWFLESYGWISWQQTLIYAIEILTFLMILRCHGFRLTRDSAETSVKDERSEAGQQQTARVASGIEG